MELPRDIPRWPAWIFKAVVIVGFAILFTRLFELTVIKGAYYQDLAEGNRIRRIPIDAPRGEIHARGGEVIAGNIKTTQKLKFDPISGFEILDESAEGEDYFVWKREYPLGSALGHVTGYVGEANEEEVGKVSPECAGNGVTKPRTFVGRTGLEEEYECDLEGTDGEELFEVNSKGQLVRKLGKRDAVPGDNIVTNIDFGLQEKVHEVMRDKVGAVIVSDVQGEVLAFYSSPSYDPNIFILGDGEGINKLFSDSRKPFFNRVIGGIYHPGSVFKPFVSVAALAEGVIDKKFLYEDTGKVVVETGVGDFTYNNWYFTQYGGVEGKIDVVRALARSTDTFFYKVGEFLGIDEIASWAIRFGLQGPTGIDLPGEVTGLIPTPEWKREVKGESWFLGNTYHVSIGQGDLAVSPIAINSGISAILTGKYCPPRLVGNSECEDLRIDEKYRNIVLTGMKAVCSEGGTANVFFDWEESRGSAVACKTGTAETGMNDKTHAWFTIIAPITGSYGADENTVVMTVLVEEGGEGSQVAAPIAREVLDYWFSR